MSEQFNKKYDSFVIPARKEKSDGGAAAAKEVKIDTTISLSGETFYEVEYTTEQKTMLQKKSQSLKK